MVIDYSRWDNITTSSEEEEDDEEAVQRGSTAAGETGRLISVGAPAASTMIRLDDFTGSRSTLTDIQLAGIPKIVLLVRSTNRDHILGKMISNDLEDARPLGPYGISLPVRFINDSVSFASFFPGFGNVGTIQIAASLLLLSTAEYLSTYGAREDFKDSMCGVPYDAQFRGDFLSTDESALHVRYGQERQALYQHVAGPEFKECKMGPMCGGPVVLVQARMRTSAWADVEEYNMETINVEVDDIPRIVTELLNVPADEFAY